MLALFEVVELPRRRGEENEAALREKEGLRSLVFVLEVVGILEVLFACDRGGGGTGTSGMAGIGASGPSRVVGLDDEDGTKVAEEKMSAEGGGRCMIFGQLQQPVEGGRRSETGLGLSLAAAGS